MVFFDWDKPRHCSARWNYGGFWYPYVCLWMLMLMVTVAMVVVALQQCCLWKLSL